VRVLIVTQYFWPENFRINDLALGLLERGHQVTVLTGIPNYPDGRFFPDYGFFKNVRYDYHGVKVIRVPLVPRGKGGRLRLPLNYLSFALCASILAPFLCRGNFDLIFVYEPSPITVGLPALVLKKLKSVPVLFWVQDLWPESLSATDAVKSQWILDRVKTLVRFIYSRCDRILVQSRAFSKPIMSLGIEAERLTYFPNSAESLYKPVSLEADAIEREKMPEGFKVMFAGNIGAAQDFSTILKASEFLKEYPDIHFIILGDGRMHSWVASQIRARGLTDSFHLLGRYPVETMPRYFSLADVMLVTLRKEPIFELTIPAKMQSYMACARPIIAALDGEGARVVNEADAGISCPAENPEALAQAIITMYKTPENRKREMGANSRKYFEANFERNFLLNRLDGLMKEMKVGA